MRIEIWPRARASRLLIGGAAIVLAAHFASPASAIEVGEVATGYAEINGRQVPLPDGEWTLAGKARNGVISGVAGAFGTIDSNVLFKIDSNRVRGIDGRWPRRHRRTNVRRTEPISTSRTTQRGHDAEQM